MKKYLKIILLLSIIAAFIIIGTSLAFADDEVPCKTILTSGTSKPAYSEALTAGYSYYNGTEDVYFFNVYPVKATGTGKMYIDVKTPDSNTATVKTAIGTITDDGKFSWRSKNSVDTYPGSKDIEEGSFDVKKGKTYYIGLASNDFSVNTAQVKAYIYSYKNNRTLKQSSKYLIASTIKGSSDKDTKLCYKIKPAKTGVITVTLKKYGASWAAGDITLLSSSKKARSEKLYYSSTKDAHKVRFGVKKGVTYYLKVSDVYSSYKYGIKYSLKAATDRKISKKSKAKTLKRKAKATSTLFIANGSKETDWYKFKVTKSRTTVLKVDASEMRGNDQKLTITVYKGSNKVDSVTLYAGNVGEYTLTYGYFYGMAAPGTYYIKITRTAKLSGKYKIRYVQ